MCGIVGAVGERDVVPVLMEGLRRLEYRGYDSAGVAVVDESARLERRRTSGKVSRLSGMLDAAPLRGTIGIAHTRWATHGVPSERNAHPHVSREAIAVVHNGIIENHEALRRQLLDHGYEFASDTDTEVIAKLIDRCVDEGRDLTEAVCAAARMLRGAYAIGVIDAEHPDRIIGARLGCPLAIGLGEGEHFIASDVAALIPVTRRFVHLEDGDVADIRLDKVSVTGLAGRPVARPVVVSRVSADAVERGRYRHYMQKEIFEQPDAISATLEGRLGGQRVLEAAFGPEAEAIFDRVARVQIVACGTSHYAGMVARNWFEGLAGIPCRVEVASEFRYRHPVASRDTLVVSISQSGETADTLGAARSAKLRGFGPTLAISNTPESALVRESELALMTRAGPEIGVASTKTFAASLVALLLLVVALGRRHALDADSEARIVAQLRGLPELCRQVLALDEKISLLARRFIHKQHALFLGRECSFRSPWKAP